MKFELNEADLDRVAGGTVIISKDHMIIGFDTGGDMYHLQGCTYKEARDLRDKFLDENPQMSNAAFDDFCREEFDKRGWLGERYY